MRRIDPADEAFPSQWPPWKVAEEISRLKARLGEAWEEETCKAILGRNKTMLELISYVFSAGKHAECPFIEWLDREALLAYIHYPCNQSNEENHVSRTQDA